MSFGTDIYATMIGDTSINAQVNGIYFENLPENCDLTKTYIVYSFKKEIGISTFVDQDLLSNYILYVNVITTDNDSLLSLSEYIQDYLTSIVNISIRFIDFVADSHSLDLEKNIYENRLEFNVIYK
jgi:hypothetical protein